MATIARMASFRRTSPPLGTHRCVHHTYMFERSTAGRTSSTTATTILSHSLHHLPFSAFLTLTLRVPALHPRTGTFFRPQAGVAQAIIASPAVISAPAVVHIGAHNRPKRVKNRRRGQQQHGARSTANATKRRQAGLSRGYTGQISGPVPANGGTTAN